VCWWDERTGGSPAGQTKVRTRKLRENIGKFRNVSEHFSEYEKILTLIKQARSSHPGKEFLQLPKLFVFAKLLTKAYSKKS
jgi:hypothetical protein